MSFTPNWTVAPGETLREILSERGISQTALAKQTGLSLKHINQVVKGKATITIPTALALQDALGITAEFWLGLEMHHRLFLARQS